MVVKCALLLFLILFVFVCVVTSATVKSAYVIKTSRGEFQIKSGVSKNFVAKASFANGINETG